MAERPAFRAKKGKNLTAAEQEALLNKIPNEATAESATDSKTKRKVQRVTVDFPKRIYEQMKLETEENGQTLKGFIVGLVRDHFVRKENNQ